MSEFVRIGSYLKNQTFGSRGARVLVPHSWRRQWQRMQRNAFAYFFDASDEGNARKSRKEVSDERNESEKVYATNARDAADASDAKKRQRRLFLRCVAWKPD